MEIIHLKKAFLGILERERVRTDRTGHEFSIILFNMENAGNHDLDIKALGYLIRKRIRCYDDIGWFEEKHLGILLPHCSFEEADRLGEEISRTIIPKKFNSTYTILTYPTHWDSNKEKKQTSAAGDASSKQPEKQAALKDSEIFFKQIQNPQNHMPRWKRGMDICGGMAGLILLAPVFLFIALFVKAVSPGPVFFIQKRVGFLGKTFGCFKFRTMHINTGTSVHNHHFNKLMSSEKPMKKLDSHDPRIIPCGLILRKTGLDELPQLLNVIMGDMSLIGPRPCIPYEAKEYKLWQRKRFEAVPGITGLWQVNGKNNTTFNEMMRYDISYALNKNIFLDASILLKTIPSIIHQAIENKHVKGEK